MGRNSNWKKTTQTISTLVAKQRSRRVKGYGSIELLVEDRRKWRHLVQLAKIQHGCNVTEKVSEYIVYETIYAFVSLSDYTEYFLYHIEQYPFSEGQLVRYLKLHSSEYQEQKKMFVNSLVLCVRYSDCIMYI